MKCVHESVTSYQYHEGINGARTVARRRNMRGTLARVDGFYTAKRLNPGYIFVA